MEIALKQRLLGAVILLSLAILGIPMLLDSERPELAEPIEIAPPTDLTFTYETLPNEPIAPKIKPTPAWEAADVKPTAPAKPTPPPDIATAQLKEKPKTKPTAKPKPPAKTPPATEPRWFIQAGVFADENNAKTLGALLRQAGYSIQLSPMTRNNETQQRVWVGPYPSAVDANQALKGIQSKRALKAVHEGWVVKQ